MEKSVDAVLILKKEYNITTVKELNAAIEKIGCVDISIFCEKENKSKELIL